MVGRMSDLVLELADLFFRLLWLGLGWFFFCLVFGLPGAACASGWALLAAVAWVRAVWVLILTPASGDG